MACGLIRYATIPHSILVGEVQVIYQKPRATIHYVTIRTSILGHLLVHLGCCRSCRSVTPTVAQLGPYPQVYNDPRCNSPLLYDLQRYQCEVKHEVTS